MPITTPFQLSYNGLTFGAGTDIQVSEIDGLRALPAIRSGDVPRARQDGDWAGLNYLDERIITIDMEIFAPQTQTFESAVASVAAAFQNITDPTAQLPLEFYFRGWLESRRMLCRPTKAATPVDSTFGFQHAKPVVELTANDPLLYSSTLHSVSTGLPSPTTGLTFPVTFPATFGSSSGGSMSATNLGNYATAPVITITGPVTNPVVTFVASGAFMKLNLTLGPTDTLVIDMGARTVTLNGTASRYNTIVTGSSWWTIPPGTWSIGVASSDSTAVAATFTTQWRDAWGNA